MLSSKPTAGPSGLNTNMSNCTCKCQQLHNDLINKLADEVSESEHLPKIKRQLWGTVGVGTMKNLDRLSLLNHLEEKNLISLGNYGYLQDLLKGAGIERLCATIQKTENEISKCDTHRKRSSPSRKRKREITGNANLCEKQNDVCPLTNTDLYKKELETFSLKAYDICSIITDWQSKQQDGDEELSTMVMEMKKKIMHLEKNMEEEKDFKYKKKPFPNGTDCQALYHAALHITYWRTKVLSETADKFLTRLILNNLAEFKRAADMLIKKMAHVISLTELCVENVPFGAAEKCEVWKSIFAHISPLLSCMWKEMALHLKFTVENTQAIVSQHPNEEEAQCLECLENFLERNYDQPVKQITAQLLTALYMMHQPKIADTVADLLTMGGLPVCHELIQRPVVCDTLSSDEIYEKYDSGEDNVSGNDSDSNEIFLGITKNNPKEFRERFHRLCASGKIPVYRQRVAVVGPYGAGKTHLAKRLIQEKYDEGNDANTPGVKIYRHRCIVHKAGRSCWIRGKDDPEDQFVQKIAIGMQKPETFGHPLEMDQTPSAESLIEILNGKMEKRAPRTGDSGSYTSPDRVAAATPGDSGSHASPVRTVDHLKNIDPKLLDKVEKIARGEPVDPEKHVTIWDFGGQDVYYTTHQTFLSEHIIYLLVFRLDVDLDEKIPVYRGEKTVKEFIMFWLNSIHMHTIGRLREEDKNVIPYVLIIGTHKDMLGPQVDVKDIFGKLRKCLDDKQVLKDHVYQYFAINNLAEDDAEFDEIKRVVEKLCGYSSNTEDTVQKFSVGWIQLEMDLAKKSEENPIITIEELRKMAQRVGLTDGELQKDFIPYHHRQGDILHFSVHGLENVVIIDPLWLADVFSAIMTPAISDSECNYMDLLKADLKLGVLKEEVFDECLEEIKMKRKKNDIILLMMHFDLMIEISQSVENPLPGSGKRTFLVPSMLVSKNSALSEKDPQRYLLIAFPHILFPTGLFHRLTIRLLRKYKAQRYENNIPVVGFDSASFRLDDKQSVLHLVMEDKAMKLFITNATGNSPEPHIYSNAQKTVKDELSTLQDTYCPRMHFGYYIRTKNDGSNIPIEPQDIQTKDVICAYVETSEVSIDLRPFRVWFLHEEKDPRRPQSLSEDDLFRDKAFDEKQVYKNYTEWRGKAVIVNNISFDNKYYPDRDGTEVDVERLEILFQQLHYLVSKHDNLSAGSINQLAERESRTDHSAYSSFIMVILSHGSENTVIGTDGYHIGYNQIMAHFEASRCTTLIGKPKMFFISACQSSPVENATVLETKPTQVRAKLQEAPQTPEKADMVLVVSTTRGDRSWRTPTNGTWFIKNLAEELLKRASDTHLLDILTQVNRSMSQMTTHEGCRQVSTIEMCTLMKQLYFWPGYYCENGEIKQFPP